MRKDDPSADVASSDGSNMRSQDQEESTRAAAALQTEFRAPQFSLVNSRREFGAVIRSARAELTVSDDSGSAHADPPYTSMLLSGDALSVASERMKGESGRVLQFSVGGSVTAAVGLFYPVIGFGPYASVGANLGVSSEGDLILQAQVSYGIGMGTFVGFGPNWQISKGPITPGHSRSFQLEANAGLVKARGLQMQVSDDSWAGGSGLPYAPKAVEFGVGAHWAVGLSDSFTYKIPAAKIWNDFTTSVGLRVYEAEVQIYQRSRAMEPKNRP